MCCVRNHIEVKSEEEVIRGVQWSNQHMDQWSSVVCK